MASISEGYIISSILQVHFEGTNTGVQASESGGAAMDLRRKAEFMLSSILASSNIFLPSMPSPPNNAGFVPQMQPLILPEETPLTVRADLVTNNYVLVGKASEGSIASSSSSLFDESARIFSSTNSTTNNCNHRKIYD
jgi:hypothetical protein